MYHSRGMLAVKGDYVRRPWVKIVSDKSREYVRLASVLKDLASDFEAGRLTS